MKHLILAITLAIFSFGCAYSKIQPIDGVSIAYEADIDNVEGSVKVSPAVMFCELEGKLPFPTGKLGSICDAIVSKADGATGEVVGEGTVSEVRTLPATREVAYQFADPSDGRLYCVQDVDRPYRHELAL